MLTCDYVIVGSGLTGTVIARSLVDDGREVVVLERRSHLGGNVRDQIHPSGIRMNLHGPHYFRTNSDRIWDYATRFAAFFRYEAALLSVVDGQFENWPIAASYIRRHFGAGWKPEFTGKPQNFEEAALSLMPRLVYEKFVKEYTEKQWGVPAHTLSADLCKRFEVRQDDEPRLRPECKYQGIPEPGYAEWMRRMLDGIPVLVNFDYLKRRDDVHARKLLVFTGPVDEYFDFDLGRLAYRGQRRMHRYLADTEFAQPCGQVNNPRHSGGPYIRTIEWKHMMQPAVAGRVKGTVLTTETPFTPTDPSEYEYPFPDRANAELAEAYRFRSSVLENVLICGRLGQYRYYDMDQAIGRAMALAAKILGRRDSPEPAIAAR
jgi:UDP-galactopyranose mutase